MHRFHFALFALLAATAFASGCKKDAPPSGGKAAAGSSAAKIEVSLPGAEKTSTQVAFAPPAHHGEEGTVKLKDKTGEVEFGSATVPDGYPKDLVPPYPGASVVMSGHTVSGGKDAFTLVLSTADAAEKVFAFYKDAIKAKPTEEMNGAGMHLLVYKDKANPPEIVVTISGEHGKTNINLVIEKDAPKP